MNCSLVISVTINPPFTNFFYGLWTGDKGSCNQSIDYPVGGGGSNIWQAPFLGWYLCSEKPRVPWLLFRSNLLNNWEKGIEEFLKYFYIHYIFLPIKIFSFMKKFILIEFLVQTMQFIIVIFLAVLLLSCPCALMYLQSEKNLTIDCYNSVSQLLHLQV